MAYGLLGAYIGRVTVGLGAVCVGSVNTQIGWRRYRHYHGNLKGTSICILMWSPRGVSIGLLTLSGKSRM